MAPGKTYAFFLLDACGYSFLLSVSFSYAYEVNVELLGFFPSGYSFADN
jgi:hypothetical protein